MQALFIDTSKREIGTVIAQESLKVLMLIEHFQGDVSDWYSHLVWRFQVGQSVKWFHRRGKDRIPWRGHILEIKENVAICRHSNKSYEVPLSALHPL